MAFKDDPVRAMTLLPTQWGKESSFTASKRNGRHKLNARVISTQPVAVSYQITEFGKTALDFLNDLKNWVVMIYDAFN